MTKQRNQSSERRQRAAALVRAQKRRERTRSIAIIGGSLAVSATIIGVAATALVLANQEREEQVLAAQRPIDGVEEFDGLTNQHVSTTMSYPQTPPVGGDHAPTWTNCGVYETPIDPTTTTHSLEHGAVWIGYEPDLPAASVEILNELGRANPYVLVSPVEGVPKPVTLSAWGKQLAVDSADDPRIAVFVRKYQQGEDAPEPGAACTGGVGGM